MSTDPKDLVQLESEREFARRTQPCSVSTCVLVMFCGNSLRESYGVLDFIQKSDFGLPFAEHLFYGHFWGGSPEWDGKDAIWLNVPADCPDPDLWKHDAHALSAIGHAYLSGKVDGAREELDRVRDILCRK